MKKLLAILLAVLALTVCFALLAHADMDDGDFDNWYVVCGPAGYRFKDYLYNDESDTSTPFWENLIPGTKLRVQGYDFESKEYMLVISDNDLGSRYEGRGIVHVSESQLDKYFSGEKKPIRKTYGEELKKEVKCVVTPKVGLILRQGPNENYPAYRTIPYDTELSYKYLCKTDKYNWAYVTYKGQDGWCCVNYTEKIVSETTNKETARATTEAAAETTTEAATEPTAAATTESTTKAVDEATGASIIPLDAADPALTTESAEENETGDFFDSTKNVILICCVGAVILAMTAAVILMIVKKKKKD